MADGTVKLMGSGRKLGRGFRLCHDEILGVIVALGEATRCAIEPRFNRVELHGARGFLIQNFFSPLFNQRHDEWVGSLENHMASSRRSSGSSTCVHSDRFCRVKLTKRDANSPHPSNRAASLKIPTYFNKLTDISAEIGKSFRSLLDTTSTVLMGTEL